MKAVFSLYGDGRAGGIFVGHIGDHRVGEKALNDNGIAAVTDDIGYGDVAHAVGIIFTIEAAVTEQKRADAGIDVGRGVDHAVDHDIIDARQSGQKADGVAEVGVSDDVADDDVVNILFAARPVVVHDVSMSKSSTTIWNKQRPTHWKPFKIS